LAQDHWVEDAEQLHQVRVSARRLGAVLDLVDAESYPGHKRQRRALKRLVDTLGLPRELDVHAEYLQTRHQEARTLAQAAVLEHLLEHLERGRAKARRAMDRDLAELDLGHLNRLLEVPSLADPFQPTSLQEAAWACLEPRGLAALGGLAALVLEEDPPALHKARVRIKKLRYTIEALESAFGDIPEGLLKTLRSLQSALGEHHDLATLEALLCGVETGLRTRERSALCAGVFELLGEVSAARRRAFERFRELARDLGSEPFALAVRPALGLPPLEGLG
jgi:CHAD domain-containing protein